MFILDTRMDGWTIFGNKKYFLSKGGRRHRKQGVKISNPRAQICGETSRKIEIGPFNGWANPRATDPPTPFPIKNLILHSRGTHSSHQIPIKYPNLMDFYD